MPGEATVPAITVETVIAAIESTLLARRGSSPEIRPDTRLEDLELNSLDFAEVFVSIQEVVGFELDPESAGDVQVVADLAQVQPL